MALGSITFNAVSWTTGDYVTETKMDNMQANTQAYDAHASEGMLLNNNVGYYQKDSGGTNREILNLDSSDEVNVGHPSLPLNLLGTITGLELIDAVLDNPAVTDGSFDTPVISNWSGWQPVTESLAFYSRTQAYTNDPAAGVGITLNVASTTDLTVGARVNVSSSAGNEDATIISLVANTSITVNRLSLNHTTSSPLITLLDHFKITGVDLTSRYAPMVKLRYKQGGGYKYAYIGSSWVSGSDTVGRIVPNKSHAILNATITDVSISLAERPSGFPNWTESVVARAYRSSSQSISTDVYTVVNMDAELFDIGSDYNTSTYTFTAPIAGVYLVAGIVNLDDMVDAKRIAGGLFVNDVLSLQTQLHGSHTQDLQALVSGLIKMQYNEPLQLKVYQDSGISKNLLGSLSTATMSVSLVSIG